MADEIAETSEQAETTESNGQEEITAGNVHTLDDAALDAQLMAEEGTPAEEEKQEEVKTEEVAEAKPDQAEIDRLAKQAADKEAFIQRQAAEIGELRKQAELLKQQYEATTAEEMTDRYYENPVEAVNQVLAIREQQAQAEKLQMLANVKQNEMTVKEFVPDFDELMDDIVVTLKDMKYTDEVIQGFKANPFAENAAIVVNLAARAKLEKENKALKAEIETLKKAPDAALKKVEQAARQVLTSGTGKAGASGAITKPQVANMSLAQIEAALLEPD